MAIDWKVLTQVRDRHKQVAQEEVARERRIVEQREAEARQAEERLQAQIESKAQLWERSITSQTGGFSVAQLCQASTWSRTLDTRIAEAGTKLREAEQMAAQQQERLEMSRQQLRAAAGDLQKAEQMGLRARAAKQRLTETHMEGAAEDVALQIWTTRARGAAPS